MANKDRMIVPFICAQCGANLNPRKSTCDFCHVAWEKVERYNGPEVKNVHLGGSLSTVGSMTLTTANCSFPMLFNVVEEPTPIFEMGKAEPVGFVTQDGRVEPNA